MELMVITSTRGQGVTTRCGILAFLIMEAGKYVLLPKHFLMNSLFKDFGFLPSSCKYYFLIVALGTEVSSFKCKMVAGGV
ncbi:hypothetical protein ERO13_D06G056466v2 [Gossypium hirsutum]|uniref:Uncharacterized protein n=1 Tax=Gossypium barbadense TaxID=3634 RepID=A0A5J5QZY3_GOSBA|nr:hypothetical protein ES319_D06G066400v1 [Gossypium barbadense]KAG4141128.1 hypothetical protein ERO13_D06G056466v2 [Gossypium hirsutum]